MLFGNRKKNIIDDLFSLALSHFKKYHPSGNLKFDNLGIFQCLKLRLMGKILQISLKDIPALPTSQVYRNIQKAC